MYKDLKYESSKLLPMILPYIYIAGYSITSPEILVLTIASFSIAVFDSQPMTAEALSVFSWANISRMLLIFILHTMIALNPNMIFTSFAITTLLTITDGNISLREGLKAPVDKIFHRPISRLTENHRTEAHIGHFIFYNLLTGIKYLALILLSSYIPPQVIPYAKNHLPVCVLASNISYRALSYVKRCLPKPTNAKFKR